jgi:hypothetical protein
LSGCRRFETADTLPGVRALRAVPVVVLLVACGSAGGSPTGGGDYFGQLERISQNAHIQERGLVRALDQRVEEAATPRDRLGAIEVTMDQRVRLYEDVVAALNGLETADGIEAAHEAYVQAWEELLELNQKVRDSGVRTVPEYLATLQAEAFDASAANVRSACEGLQTVASAADRPVDLACDGRPG